MSTIPKTSSQEPEYAWELATLYPAQGAWREAEYLDLTDGTNRRIEFADGRLEFLAMPTELHEALVQYLFLALHAFVAKAKLGKVYNTGIRIRVRPDQVRLPDVLFLHKDHYSLRHNRVWDGADLVMEIVSGDPKDRQRDYETKLVDYAEAGIAEYWIVDYEERKVQVHRLDSKRYALHGEFTSDQQATSALLEGFVINVGELFAAADEVPE
jgi:Uma2 family endonuclease